MNKNDIITIVVLLALGVVATYIASLVEALLSGQVLVGAAGFPFKYGYSSFFGGSTVNQTMFLLDIAFWFIVLFALWKLFSKILNK